jgi:D-serine deaminase-like pyridoxal phosphate-dependent protein
MPPDQLRAEWRRIYQAPASLRLTPDLLRRGIAYRLQERLHGGLPNHIARELDRQAKRKLADIAAAAAAATSGASVEGAGARGSPRDDIVPRRVDEPCLRPGTRLVRSWQGRTCSVLVT